MNFAYFTALSDVTRILYLEGLNLSDRQSGKTGDRFGGGNRWFGNGDVSISLIQLNLHFLKLSHSQARCLSDHLYGNSLSQ